MINRRLFAFVTLVSSLVAGGCASSSDEDTRARRSSIDAQSELAISNLYAKSPGTKELVQRARGVLVFPSVLSAGLVVGGSHGDGKLLVGSRTTGYYATTSATLGLTAGAQTKSVFILFMTNDALQKFQTSSGWTAGVDASVTLVSVGAGGTIDTETVRSPVVGFVLSKEGLMADLSLEGAKVSRLPL